MATASWRQGGGNLHLSRQIIMITIIQTRLTGSAYKALQECRMVLSGPRRSGPGFRTARAKRLKCAREAARFYLCTPSSCINGAFVGSLMIGMEINKISCERGGGSRTSIFSHSEWNHICLCASLSGQCRKRETYCIFLKRLMALQSCRKQKVLFSLTPTRLCDAFEVHVHHGLSLRK